MNVSLVLRDMAAHQPDAAYLTDLDRHFTYGDIEYLTRRMVNYLLQSGVQPGDRIATQMLNSADFVLIYYAAIRIGAVIVPIGFTLKPREVDEILFDCNPRLLFRHQTIEQQPDNVLHYPCQRQIIDETELGTTGNWHWLSEFISDHFIDLTPDAPLGILYSSGTTGVAKGVLLSHSNIFSNMLAANECYQMQASDRTVLFLPLSHCFGLNAILNCITCSGASMYILRKFTPPALYAVLQHQHITMFFGVPFVFNLLLKDLPDDGLFDRTQYFFSAASKLALETENAWLQRFGRPIHQGYGLTETSPFATYMPRNNYMAGSIGIPIKDCTIAIVNESKVQIPFFEWGEIAIKGPNVMLGYYNKKEMTDAVLQNGWFYSGDVGYMHPDGSIFIVDRIKDMIIVKGENVYPSEVENVILELPYVDEVAVYGVANAMSEESVRARIVLKKGYAAEPKQIIEHCKTQLAPFKVPYIIEFGESLPKSPSGKILKRVLRDESMAQLNPL